MLRLVIVLMDLDVQIHLLVTMMKRQVLMMVVVSM